MSDVAPDSADPAPIEVDTSTAGVALIRLNRPERLNAITVDLARDLRASLIELSRDPGCRAIVVTGNGRAFCAGADREMIANPRGPADSSSRDGIGHEMLDVFLDVIRAVRAAPVPVIAAVNGAAIGGGMALAVAADIRVAARAASFHVGTIRVGLTGGEAGLSWLLPRIMGMSRAMELLVTGRPLDAVEAAAGGLVSTVAEDPAGCVDAALEIADAIQANSPTAVRMTKQLVLANQDTSFESALSNEATAQLYVSRGWEFREAAAAFAERRRPSFADDDPGR